MVNAPLTIPLIVDPLSTDHALPVQPTRLATWTAGTCRRVALASSDNTIWVHTSSLLPAEDASPPAPAQPLPSIITSSPFGSATLQGSDASRNAVHRSRAASSTSSGLTRSSKIRLASGFSPTLSATHLPTTSLTAATATLNAHDEHGHRRTSLSERAELLEHLREQAKDQEEEDSTFTRLSALARRGLPGVHGKEDYDFVDGSMSPRSTVSIDSQRTFTDMFSWKRAEEEEERKTREIKEKIEEVDVQREMEKETREGEREKQEARAIEAAQRRPERGPKPRRSATTIEEESKTVQKSIHRLVLPLFERGAIVCMTVVEDVGLVVLRDVGLLDIYSLSDLSIVTSLDLENSPGSTASSSKTRLSLSPSWYWRSCHFVKEAQSPYLFVDGIPWPCGIPSPNGDVTHVVIVPIGPHKNEKVSHLDLPGVGHIAVTSDSSGHPQLLHFLSLSLMSYPIQSPSMAVQSSQEPDRQSSPFPRAVPAVLTTPSLSILRSATPNPSTSSRRDDPPLRKNKSYVALRPETEDATPVRADKSETDRGLSGLLGRRKAPKVSSAKAQDDAPLSIGEGKEVERDGFGEWVGIKMSSDGEGLGWTDDAVDVFTCDGLKLKVQGSITISARERVRDVLFTPAWRSVVISREQDTLLYRRDQSASSAMRNINFSMSQSLPRSTAVVLDQRSAFLLLAFEKSLAIMPAANADVSSVEKIAPLCRCVAETMPDQIVPLGSDQVLVLDSNGNAIKQSLQDVLASRIAQDVGIAADRAASRVTVAKTLSSPKDLFVAGDEDGVVRIWSVEPFELLGSWTCFADPVESVILLDDPPVASIPPGILCTSQNGAICFIALDIMESLFLVPAARAPLRRIFMSDHDLLLTYASGKARVWNLKTCEFRRSTGLDAAGDMLQSGDWTEILISDTATTSALPLVSTSSQAPLKSDLGRMLQLDLHAFDQYLQRKGSDSALALARSLLSLVLAWSVDAATDDMCRRELGVSKPERNVGLSSTRGAPLFMASKGSTAWQISSEATGLRQLAIVTLLRVFLISQENEQAAAEAIGYYSAGLPESTKRPDLDFFAAHYMDPAAIVQQSARLLFASTLENMSESQIEKLVQAHVPLLPQNVAPRTRLSADTVRALTLIGGIAIHRYQALSASVLKATAESIFLYLEDFSCPHIGLAIELASRAFTTWQTYIDPMELLRVLFYLSTHTPPPAAVSAQARLAVLHIASVNPGLFMSTLSMDILDAKTTEGRTSIMKLCVYMARKNPSVLENGLPRIAEAIVKSLDPNISKMREEVREAATVILNELVLAYTTIDFHSATQRLAVGTHEGAVIMYDLKSASRLYVLEAHQAPTSSVNFSSDGRRLLTVSLDEGNVTIWKVGSSLSGFFNVGGPPRQGGVGSMGKGPFKRISFIRADDGPLEEISALSDIKVEWLGERQARVMIRETALTFET
ncbi:hypothetical protein BD324DRAFT_623874 [Kockovaella imperatae]|uniref:Uncharacterized protein n=1 Tax=Kockovaella imperatae TaxID=4999 RepID=A0A1Y1UK99_9TREE|nr:hypothetical protein BD324DRAFT_623874 [Kockovaella imperatae]ORX37934.1 hypothetical protein BD324DRAFT_623874 [Kockovaella imperatae]